jgi:hypothetical protein
MSFMMEMWWRFTCEHLGLQWVPLDLPEPVGSHGDTHGMIRGGRDEEVEDRRLTEGLGMVSFS